MVEAIICFSWAGFKFKFCEKFYILCEKRVGQDSARSHCVRVDSFIRVRVQYLEVFEFSTCGFVTYWELMLI